MLPCVDYDRARDQPAGVGAHEGCATFAPGSIAESPPFDRTGFGEHGFGCDPAHAVVVAERAAVPAVERAGLAGERGAQHPVAVARGREAQRRMRRAEHRGHPNPAAAARCMRPVSLVNALAAGGSARRSVKARGTSARRLVAGPRGQLRQRARSLASPPRARGRPPGPPAGRRRGSSSASVGRPARPGRKEGQRAAGQVASIACARATARAARETRRRGEARHRRRAARARRRSAATRAHGRGCVQRSETQRRRCQRARSSGARAGARSSARLRGWSAGRRRRRSRRTRSRQPLSAAAPRSSPGSSAHTAPAHGWASTISAYSRLTRNVIASSGRCAASACPAAQASTTSPSEPKRTSRTAGASTRLKPGSGTGGRAGARTGRRARAARRGGPARRCARRRSRRCGPRAGWSRGGAR